MSLPSLLNCATLCPNVPHTVNVQFPSGRHVCVWGYQSSTCWTLLYMQLVDLKAVQMWSVSISMTGYTVASEMCDETVYLGPGHTTTEVTAK